MWFSELTRLFSLFYYFPLTTYPHYWWLFFKNVIEIILCEITNSHSYCVVSVSRYLVKNIDIYIYILECTTSRQSQPTWSIIINIDRYETSLSWQVFQLYCPGLLLKVNALFPLTYTESETRKWSVPMGISVISDVPAKLVPSVIFWIPVCLDYVPKNELLEVKRTYVSVLA